MLCLYLNIQILAKSTDRANFATRWAPCRIDPKPVASPLLTFVYGSHILFSWGSNSRSTHLDSVCFLACVPVNHTHGDNGGKHLRHPFTLTLKLVYFTTFHTLFVPSCTCLYHLDTLLVPCGILPCARILGCLVPSRKSKKAEAKGYVS